SYSRLRRRARIWRTWRYLGNGLKNDAEPAACLLLLISEFTKLCRAETRTRPLLVGVAIQLLRKPRRAFKKYLDLGGQGRVGDILYRRNDRQRTRQYVTVAKDGNCNGIDPKQHLITTAFKALTL